MIFYNEKRNILGYKNKRFYKAKDFNFSKGVTPWFWSKISHFSNFFFANLGQQNVFYHILERKNAFLG